VLTRLLNVYNNVEDQRLLQTYPLDCLQLALAVVEAGPMSTEERGGEGFGCPSSGASRAVVELLSIHWEIRGALALQGLPSRHCSRNVLSRD
jgi:hypothetical protein